MRYVSVFFIVVTFLGLSKWYLKSPENVLKRLALISNSHHGKWKPRSGSEFETLVETKYKLYSGCSCCISKAFLCIWYLTGWSALMCRFLKSPWKVKLEVWIKSYCCSKNLSKSNTNTVFGSYLTNIWYLDSNIWHLGPNSWP